MSDTAANNKYLAALEKRGLLPSVEQRSRKYPIVYVQPWKGLQLAIENPAGTIRSGKKPDGTEWVTRMQHAYGEITDSLGVDGDPVDVFLGPELETATHVFVVHQRRVDDWQRYDEDKCMLGFASKQAATAAFLANYDDPRFLGPMTTLTVGDFINKVRATKDKPAMIKSLCIFLRAKP
jgi:hypothetical protein